jgi:hypothetical protein
VRRPGPVKTEFAEVTMAHAFQNSLPNLTAEQVVTGNLVKQHELRYNLAYYQ